MTPMSPVLPTQLQWGVYETTFAKDQPEYQPLPAVRLPGEERIVISRWRLTFKERLAVLLLGDLYIQQLTFGHPLQPILPHVREPIIEERA